MNAGLLLTIIAAYFVGSIPTGYLVARFRGVDLRAHGSGNIGATNAFRVLGKVPGLFVLLMDALKGVAAVLVLPGLVQRLGFADPTGFLPLIAGVGSILGHNYTCWLGFKGGKGIATTAGVMGALLPWALLIALSLWILVLWLTRFVSIASIVAAAVLPVATVLTSRDRSLWVVSLVFGGLAIWRHRGNIQRLRAGTESRIQLGGKRSSPPQA